MIRQLKEAGIIFFDRDDTLGDYIGPFVDFHNQTYGTKLSPKDFTTRRFHPLLGCTGEEAKRRVDEFQNSPYYERIVPLEGAVDAVNQLFDMGKELHVLTSTDPRLNLRGFCEQYFPGKFSGIHYSTNHYTHRTNSGKTKGEICKDFSLRGKVVLVDDDLAYTLQCTDLGIDAVLFGGAAWTPQDNLPLNIGRLPSWRMLNAN